MEQTRAWKCKQNHMLNLHQQAWIQKGSKKAVVMHTLDEWLQKQSTAELNLEIFPAAKKLENLATFPQCTKKSVILMFQ